MNVRNLAGLVLCLATATLAAPSSGATRHLGTSATMGGGKVATYAEVDASGRPAAIGVTFSDTALANLPMETSDGNHCFDENGDGKLDRTTECNAWHERVLPLPSELAHRNEMPFKWALLNWNPIGHFPPGIFDKQHFDVHFYIEPIESIFAIQRGPCGLEKVRCDQFVVGQKPVPDNYLPKGYQDLGLVAPAMGNHVVDMSDKNFHGEPFSRHWIYGIYDGRVIFYEEMVSLAFLQSRLDVCNPIPQAEAFGLAGWYPTQSCIRWDAERREHTVSLEGFALRTVSPPGPGRPPAPPPPAPAPPSN